MENYPISVYRVDVNYYAYDYDYKVCEISSPFKTIDAAKAAYSDAIKERCIDVPEKTARVALTETIFPSPREYGTTKTLLKNY